MTTKEEELRAILADHRNAMRLKHLQLDANLRLQKQQVQKDHQQLKEDSKRFRQELHNLFYPKSENYTEKHRLREAYATQRYLKESARHLDCKFYDVENSSVHFEIENTGVLIVTTIPFKQEEEQ